MLYTGKFHREPPEVGLVKHSALCKLKLICIRSYFPVKCVVLVLLSCLLKYLGLNSAKLFDPAPQQSLPGDFDVQL